MANVLRHLSRIRKGMELDYPGDWWKAWTENRFTILHKYIAPKKKISMILILDLIGILGFAGLHRFYFKGRLGLGTFISYAGTLFDWYDWFDLVNYKSLAYEIQYQGSAWDDENNWSALPWRNQLIFDRILIPPPKPEEILAFFLLTIWYYHELMESTTWLIVGAYRAGG